MSAVPLADSRTRACGNFEVHNLVGQSRRKRRPRQRAGERCSPRTSAAERHGSWRRTNSGASCWRAALFGSCWGSTVASRRSRCASPTRHMASRRWRLCPVPPDCSSTSPMRAMSRSSHSPATEGSGSTWSTSARADAHRSSRGTSCRPGSGALCSRCPSRPREEALVACWTRKEAYVKGTGEGLTAALDLVEVPVVDDLPVASPTVQGEDAGMVASRSRRTGRLPGLARSRRRRRLPPPIRAPARTSSECGVAFPRLPSACPY